MPDLECCTSVFVNALTAEAELRLRWDLNPGPFPAVESSLGRVPALFACDLLRFGLSFSSSLVYFNPRREFSPLLKPRLLHT